MGRPDEQYPQPGRGNHKQRNDLYLIGHGKASRHPAGLSNLPCAPIPPESWQRRFPAGWATCFPTVPPAPVFC